MTKFSKIIKKLAYMLCGSTHYKNNKKKNSLNDILKLETFTDVVEERIRYWQFEEYCNLTDWLTDRLATFLDNNFYKILIQAIAKY